MKQLICMITVCLFMVGCSSTKENSKIQEGKISGKKKETPSLYKLEHIKSIGNNDEENYIFIKIRDVKFDSNKNFYVADFKGYFLAKYDFEGKHIARTGKSGQGPKEFLSLQSIAVTKDKIYTHDPRNIRISVYDLKLKYIRSIKSPVRVNRLLHVAPNQMVTFNYSSRGLGELGRIALLNRHGKIYRSFFNRHWFGDYKEGNKRDDYIKRKATLITADYSPDTFKTLIGFRTSKNPVEIFLLNKAGSIEQTFSYKADSKYQLPEWYYNEELAHATFKPGSKKKAESNKIKIDSLLIYKNKYLVFIKYQNVGIFHQVTHKHILLVFDTKGLISETILNNDLTFFDISDDGYVIGADVEAETPTVQIHKLNIA